MIFTLVKKQTFQMHFKGTFAIRYVISIVKLTYNKRKKIERNISIIPNNSAVYKHDKIKKKKCKTLID